MCQYIQVLVQQGSTDNPLFAVLFYLFCSLACFWPADHQVESEPPKNFQDINVEDLE
jgi:hypothetical protein